MTSGDAQPRLAQERADISALKMAKQTAERVAKSTDDVVQKLSNRDGLTSLQQTAQHIAKSTGDAIQNKIPKKDLSSLEMAQLTAEHVAKLTDGVVEKLPNRDGLISLQLTAQCIAKSTSDAIQNMTTKKDLSNLQMAQQTAERVAKSTGSRLTSDQKENVVRFENTHNSVRTQFPDSSFKELLLHQNSLPAEAENTANYVAQSTGNYLEQLLGSKVTNGTRSPLNLRYNQHIYDSKRKLPSIPVSAQAVANSRIPNGLSNGHERRISPLDTRKRDEWTRMDESSSESQYSTSESTDSMPHVINSPHKEKFS